MVAESGLIKTQIKELVVQDQSVDLLWCRWCVFGNLMRPNEGPRTANFFCINEEEIYIYIYMYDLLYKHGALSVVVYSISESWAWALAKLTGINSLGRTVWHLGASFVERTGVATRHRLFVSLRADNMQRHFCLATPFRLWLPSRPISLVTEGITQKRLDRQPWMDEWGIEKKERDRDGGRGHSNVNITSEK